MKTKTYIIKYILLIPLLLQLVSCEDALEENIYSQLAPGNFLTTEEGIDASLNAVYKVLFNTTRYRYQMLVDIFETGYGYNEGGSFEARYAAVHEQFLWSTTSFQTQDNWDTFYTLVRNANIVLDNLEKGDFDESFASQIRYEALALRGYAYAELYLYYGPTPIFVSAESEEVKLARATEQEMLDRIETDLSEAAAGLPVNQDDYGRITKGGALAMLCKHYLNTKQWDKTNSTAQQIRDLNVYNLEPTYQDVFDYGNEQNQELMVVITCDVATQADWVNMGLAIPKDYPLQPGQSTYAAVLYANDWFIDMFDDKDERDDDIVLEYINTEGDTIKGYGNNKSLPMFKYGPDPSAVGVNGGLDIPILRYADILMSQAEALNELNGPTQASIDLINLVRNRAKIDPIALSNFASKEDLRDQIFKERQFEFYYERKSREDLIRQGTYISNAQDRGVNAKDHQVLYPIPQAEMDSNPNMEQNPGY